MRLMPLLNKGDTKYSCPGIHERNISNMFALVPLRYQYNTIETCAIRVNSNICKLISTKRPVKVADLANIVEWPKRG